jgi:hypothetical protein
VTIPVVDVGVETFVDVGGEVSVKAPVSVNDAVGVDEITCGVDALRAVTWLVV